MATKALHTPLPWLKSNPQVHHYTGNSFVCLAGPNSPPGSVLLQVHHHPPVTNTEPSAIARAQADIDFIFEACNRYYDLLAEVEALKQEVATLGRYLKITSETIERLHKKIKHPHG